MDEQIVLWQFAGGRLRPRGDALPASICVAALDPDVFAKELGRVRKRDGAKDPNWIFSVAVQFRDRGGKPHSKTMPVVRRRN